MIQVYPFHGTDVQEVYANLNSFLNELAIIGIVVGMEDIRSNTKYYPDHAETATTIEVFVGMDSLAPDVDGRDQISNLHRAVVCGKVEVPVAEQEEKQVAANTGDTFDPFLDSDDMP